MISYTDLFRQRSDLKRRSRRLKYEREKWREYIEVNAQIVKLTEELKRLAK
jgi:hypothetical protein